MPIGGKAVPKIDANPDELAFKGNVLSIQNLMDFLQILVSCLRY